MCLLINICEVVRVCVCCMAGRHFLHRAVWSKY